MHDATMDQRRALVVDDDEFTCWLLAELIEALGFEVAKETSAAAAIEAAADVDPDVVIADLDLGVGPTGLDVVRIIRKQSPWAAAVIMTGHKAPELVAPTVNSSDVDVALVYKADLRSADTMRSVIESAIAGQTMPLAQGEARTITSGQADLLRLIADGMSNAEIARVRGCGLRSVERQISRLFQSLGLDNDSRTNNRVRAVNMYRDSQVSVR